MRYGEHSQREGLIWRPVIFPLVVFLSEEQSSTNFIKCTILSYILDNHIGEFLLRHVGVSLNNSFALLLRSDSNNCVKTRAKLSTNNMYVMSMWLNHTHAVAECRQCGQRWSHCLLKQIIRFGSRRYWNHIPVKRTLTIVRDDLWRYRCMICSRIRIERQKSEEPGFYGSPQSRHPPQWPITAWEPWKLDQRLQM